MAWISSITSTVLPTPAPPNIAALPPWASGASRSITLMPVSKILVAEVSSSKRGGGLWIGLRGVSAGKAAPLSPILPSTSSRRPSTPRPPARTAARRSPGRRRPAPVRRSPEARWRERSPCRYGCGLPAPAFRPVPEYGQGAIDGRKGLRVLETHVHDRATDGDDLAFANQLYHILTGRKASWRGITRFPGLAAEDVAANSGANRERGSTRNPFDGKIGAFFAFCR